MKTIKNWRHYLERAAGSLRTDPQQDRILHAKGSWIAGTFSASETGLLVGLPENAPVLARFSGTLGGSAGHDSLSGDQGVLIRIGNEGTASEMVLGLFSIPVFFVRTASDMLDFLAATSSGQSEEARQESIAGFQALHPESVEAMSFGDHRLPESFMSRNYYSVHAYHAVINGVESLHRLELKPTDESVTGFFSQDFPREELSDDYLHERLLAQLPVRLSLISREPGLGETIDVTQNWVTGSQRVLGTVSLSAKVTAPQAEPELSRTGPFKAPQDQLFRERNEMYRAARELRSTAAQTQP
ncbi:catalase [Psychromicrobium sp. YIM B11713]|uniref:catalase n=1 Tax=Psychromicrobium sp. YIM B11713 TaxID=3145233 RepID=UPI00374EF37E